MFCDKGYTIKEVQGYVYYKLHSSTLSLVDPYKYLGVVLQSNLMWSKHIEAITARTNSTLGIMCCNIKKAFKSVKEQIHKVLLGPN